MKYLKLNDNTFLFNVVEDPLERANLKSHQPDVYQRLVQETTANGSRPCCRWIRRLLLTVSTPTNWPITIVPKQFRPCREEADAVEQGAAHPHVPMGHPNLNSM